MSAPVGVFNFSEKFEMHPPPPEDRRQEDDPILLEFPICPSMGKPGMSVPRLNIPTANRPIDIYFRIGTNVEQLS